MKKKEGTGRPQNPDIAIDADVGIRELRFEKVPDPEVRFRGNSRRNSVWRSRRNNLPVEVQEGVFYRNAEVRLRIASETIDVYPDLRSSSDHKRVRTNLEYPAKKPQSRNQRVKRSKRE
ncbi:MAG: hypothetical protein ACRDTR_12250 [Rubrobacter sp.]